MSYTPLNHEAQNSNFILRNPATGEEMLLTAEQMERMCNALEFHYDGVQVHPEAEVPQNINELNWALAEMVREFITEEI